MRLKEYMFCDSIGRHANVETKHLSLVLARQLHGLQIANDVDGVQMKGLTLQ